MAVPKKITPTKLGDYLEVMTRAVFQAGVSWAQIENSWPAYCDAFERWDIQKVATFKEKDVERLMQFPGVMHSKKKIVGTIKNANAIIAADREFNGFKNYLNSKSSFDELSKDMKKRFSFLGELSAYYFVFRVGGPVPDFDTWIKSIDGDHPRMREMVEANQ